MTTATAANVGEVAVYRQMAGTIHLVAARCADGISHEESLALPGSQGNCMNWVLGHLIRVYDNVMPLLQQTPLGGFERYERGGAPIKNGDEAMDFKELLQAWDESSRRIDEGLSAITSERLDQAAPFSPTNNPNETVRSLLTTILFHQSYHTGQMGLLRRLAGRPGAIG